MDTQSSPTTLERRINRLASRQYGAVSRAQLLRLGLGRDAIGYRVRSGRLSPLHRGVYAVGPGPGTKERRWAAAVLACGEGAVLSHLSAAALWELRPVDPWVIDVSVAARRARVRDGLRVHRPRLLAPEDVARRRAIPVTSVARTLVDIAEVVSRRSLERALDEAEYLALLHPPRLQETLERNHARVGAARLASCLRRHEPGTTRTKNALEEAFLTLVLDAGLPQPDVNIRLGPYEVDFLWREERVAVETDGGASHNRATNRERDAERDAWLATAGYRPLRFTWRQVTERPDEVLAALRAELGRAARSHTSGL
jgi:very-short-patch-repair endonuclease